ncbi:MAG: serine/threonine-protein kinase [Microcoleaceae cyanobacterium]
MSSPISPGLLLRNHYLIIRQLGHGGFGRTYLAKDQYRFDELCVLKEFAPQVQGSYGLKKSEELFEREAQTLYRLSHSQIPKFRELFREKIDGKGYLFVVQDYVEGLNYRELLHQRQQQNIAFTEAEIIQLMQQLLPVLAYIHQRGVIHRDISPDNIIQRQSDGLPILIDFGGVKQIQAKIDSGNHSHPTHGTPATRLGKVGYAPDEQMRLGVVYPHSDLYALAATILVLLTAKEPQYLINSQDLSWDFQQVNVSPQFATILNKILAPQPGNRYPTAQAVLRALEAVQPAVEPMTQPPHHLAVTAPVVATQPPLPIQPGVSAPIATVSSTSQPSQPTKKASNVQTTTQTSSFWKTILLVGSTMILMGFIGWLGGNWWVSENSQDETEDITDLTETQRQQKIADFRRSLDINYGFFTALVDEEFYRQYPERSGQLTDTPADQIWRQRWDQVAYELLNKLEDLSSSSREKLGRFSRSDINQWKRDINQLNLSSQALYDLSDAQFFYWFPDYPRNQSILNLSMGQVWQGITADKLQQLKDKNRLEKIQFPPQTTSKTIKGKLKPGNGKAYIANLKSGQSLQVNLLSPNDSTLLSIYTPIPGKSLLEDSRISDWSSVTRYSGYYEFVIVSNTEETIEYELIITAE